MEVLVSESTMLHSSSDPQSQDREKDLVPSKRSSFEQNEFPGSPSMLSTIISRSTTSAAYHLIQDRISPIDSFDKTQEYVKTKQFTVPADSEKSYKASPADILAPRQWSWTASTAILLAAYSTLFSGYFFIIAAVKPRWGSRVGTTIDGSLPVSMATFLSAFLSKSVELAFTTVFVILLGQLVTRRAFTQAQKPGFSLSEVNMRLWIMQPGTLITHFNGAKWAIRTLLGATAILATITAMLYTTAAETLVSPKLQMGVAEERLLLGRVRKPFADKTIYTNVVCLNPANCEETLFEIEPNRRTTQDLEDYIQDWISIPTKNETIRNETVSTGYVHISDRPSPVTKLHDNTTVFPQWINRSIDSDADRAFSDYTLAMPHSNIYSAAFDEKNRLLQPGDFQGAGEFDILASVPAPAINVRCSQLSSDELQPFVFNQSSKDDPAAGYTIPDGWPMTTALDAVFLWNSFADPDDASAPPLFRQVPPTHGITTNTSFYTEGRSIYMLSKPPEALNSQYVLCALQVMQYTNCTTKLHSEAAGDRLSVHCEDDPENKLPYIKTNTSAPLVNWEPDWRDFAWEWAKSLSLAQSNETSTLSRYLTQLPLSSNGTYKVFPSGAALPTISEALCVLAGQPLLLGTMEATFVHYWKYSSRTMDESVYERFLALVAYKDYSSGGTRAWQGVFFVILALMFVLSAISLFLLSWSFGRHGVFLDITEPQNTFALAMATDGHKESLLSRKGDGDSPDLLRQRWQLAVAGEKCGSCQWDGPASRSRGDAVLAGEQDCDGTCNRRLVLVPTNQEEDDASTGENRPRDS